MSDLQFIYLAECEYRRDGFAGEIKCRLIGGLPVERETCLHCHHIERKIKRAKEVQR